MLVGIGPPAIPALIAAVTNTFNSHRYDLIRSIDALSTNGGLAVPVLTSLLQDPDEGIRLNAKATLFEITNDSGIFDFRFSICALLTGILITSIVRRD